MVSHYKSVSHHSLCIFKRYHPQLSLTDL